MELLLEPSKARKILLLQESQLEVLVLTSQYLLEAWSPELCEALAHCARRGLRVRVLVDAAIPSPSPRLTALQRDGAEVRRAGGIFPLSLRRAPVQGELWILDRKDVVAVNERKRSKHTKLSMAVECLMGEEVASGAATYFDLRWSSASSSVIFSVRHKNYALLSGQKSPNEFFGCLLKAKKTVSLSLPGSRVAKKVESALHQVLESGVGVTIYVNAEREDAPALKRLRRLALAGAVLKICGERLSSECAVIDGTSVYMGSLPSSWRPFTESSSPVFLMRNQRIGVEILAALESQVAVEISAPPAPTSSALK
jgi:phosphatidylserine/phosphatidylglycerophosphate/cardiolipin synthase-like enzyme